MLDCSIGLEILVNRIAKGGKHMVYVSFGHGRDIRGDVWSGSWLYAHYDYD